MSPRAPDPAARAMLVAISAGRIGLGIGVTLATRPALRGLGFPEPDATGRALARLAGGRDIALGALGLAARNDRRALRTVALAGAAVDAGDSLSLGAAAARGEPVGRAGLVGSVSGAAAAAAGAWAIRRMG